MLRTRSQDNHVPKGGRSASAAFSGKVAVALTQEAFGRTHEHETTKTRRPEFRRKAAVLSRGGADLNMGMAFRGTGDAVLKGFTVTHPGRRSQDRASQRLARFCPTRNPRKNGENIFLTGALLSLSAVVQAEPGMPGVIHNPARPGVKP